MKYILLLCIATNVSALTINFNKIIESGDWKSLLTFQQEYAQLSSEQKSNYVKKAQVAVITAQSVFSQNEPAESNLLSTVGRGLALGSPLLGMLVYGTAFTLIAEMNRLKLAGLTAGSIILTTAFLLGLNFYFNTAVKSAYRDALLVREIIHSWSTTRFINSHLQV